MTGRRITLQAQLKEVKLKEVKLKGGRSRSSSKENKHRMEW